MKILRRLVLTIFVVLLILLISAGYLQHRARQAPAWYRPLALDEAARQQAANRMDQKLIGAYSAARSAQAHEIAARNNGSNPAAAEPPPAIRIAFTEDEINSFLQTWDATFHWQQEIESFIKQPLVQLENHELILAGKVNAQGAESLGSIHLVPKFEGDKFRIEIASLMAGTLPLPRNIFSGLEKQGIEEIEQTLPQLKAGAKVSPSGLANQSLADATMLELLRHTLKGESADTVFFIPERIGPNSASQMVRLLSVQIENKTLTLVFQPMTLDQGRAFAEQVNGKP